LRAKYLSPKGEKLPFGEKEENISLFLADQIRACSAFLPFNSSLERGDEEVEKVHKDDSVIVIKRYCVLYFAAQPHLVNGLKVFFLSLIHSAAVLPWDRSFGPCTCLVGADHAATTLRNLVPEGTPGYIVPARGKPGLHSTGPGGNPGLQTLDTNY